MGTPTEQTFWELFMGATLAEFLFSGFLVFFGILLYTLVRIYNRKNQDEPISWKIWWTYKNNAIEMIISLLVIYPMIRFAEVYEDWIMQMLPEAFRAVPFFIMLASGYLQHYILVKLFKATK